MKYQVVYDRDMITLEENVNDKMKRGWYPVGGISAIEKYHDFHNGNKQFVIMYAQAMTKDE